MSSFCVPGAIFLSTVRVAEDADGVIVPSAQLRWQIEGSIGSITQGGRFIAGARVGSFPSAIRVQVVSPGATATPISSAIDVVIRNDAFFGGATGYALLRPQTAVLRPGEEFAFGAIVLGATGRTLQPGQVTW